MIAIIISLLVAVAVLFGCCIRLFLSRNILQRKLSVVESVMEDQQTSMLTVLKRLAKVEKAQKEELTQDQIDYRDQIKAQYAVLFAQVEKDVKKHVELSRAETSELVKKSRAETSDLVKKSREEFDKKLTDEFSKACEQIKFNEIEYKKTITKKRKDFSRKHGKDAKPQRVWRYIDEE